MSGSPTRWSSGTQTSSKKSSRVSRPCQPMPRIFGPMVKPGVSFSTTKVANLDGSPSSDGVRASSVTPNDMSVPALEMNVFRPLISQPPSRRSARVRMPRASEPASGSVRPNAPSARPSASGRSQRSRCSSLPNRKSGSDPIVTWACQAAATDWSARPICSMAATKPTVDIPMPPHSSGISMPSRPSCAHLPQQVGRADAPPPTPAGARGRSPSARSRGRARPGRARPRSARSPRPHRTDRYNPQPCPIPTSTCWSSAPASPASTSCTGPSRPGSRRPCSRPATASAAPGTGTATPGPGSTRRATPTPTSSPRSCSTSGSGRSTSPSSPRPSATSTTSSTGSTSGATSASAPGSPRRSGTTRRGPGS